MRPRTMRTLRREIEGAHLAGLADAGVVSTSPLSTPLMQRVDLFLIENFVGHVTGSRSW